MARIALDNIPYGKETQLCISISGHHIVPHGEFWLTEDAGSEPQCRLALNESSYAGHMEDVDAYP